MNPLVVVSFIAAMAVPALGQTVIYQDSFSRGTPSDPLPISGSQPDVVDTNDATWNTGHTNNVSGTFQTDGSAATITAGNETWFYLPFSTSLIPSDTTGYLKLTGEMTSSAADAWAAMGFTSNIATEAYNDGHNWLLATNSAVQGFIGSGTGNQEVDASLSPGENYFQIELNLADNTVNFFEGTSLTDMTTLLYSGSYLASGPVDNYTGIQLEAQGTDGVQTWDNIQLAYSTTPTILSTPEPSSVWLLLGGLSGLLGFMRLRAIRA